MKALFITMAVALSQSLVSCTVIDQDSPPNYGGSGLTKTQLANEFVSQLNLEADVTYTLAKSLQTNWGGDDPQDVFIVLKNTTTGDFESIRIQGFVPGQESASEYYNRADKYFDLDYIPGHDEYFPGFPGSGEEGGYEWVNPTYRDRATGLIFEKTAATSKDLAKINALIEAVKLEKSAELISSEFGLSLSRSVEIANLQAHWRKASKKAMTDDEINSFSSELLGFSVATGIKAYQDKLNGNSSGLDSLIEKSASLNQITPEHAQQLMSKVFGL